MELNTTRIATSYANIFLSVIIGMLISCPGIFAQSTLLVDFGSSASNNSFGLTGWNTVIKSPNVNYIGDGPGGLIPNPGVEELDDYQGVQGTPRIFQIGERVVVTWFNTSDESYFMTSRISFTDADNPNEDGSGGNWYTMRSFDDYRNTYTEIPAHGSIQTAFNITDGGVHKTDETYSVININLTIEWYQTYPKQFIICDKIELYNDCDITPPGQPTGLSANVLSDSKVQLNWNEPADDVGVVEYLIYNNGEVEGYSRTNSFTCVFLEADTDYEFRISALDKAGNESIQSPMVSAHTQNFKGDASVVNPDGFEYLGAFKLPDDFNWGGEATAYNLNGDGGPIGIGSSDGYPGSLFASNVNQPENGLIGEVTIPVPVILPTKYLEELNTADILISPINIRPDNVNNLEFVDIWRMGLEYVNDENRLYSSWSIYYTVTGEKHVSISCCDVANFTSVARYGAWYLGDPVLPPNDAMQAEYLFSTPDEWANANTSGRTLVTGRYREGGLSGLGPTLYAFGKINDSPPAPNSTLDITNLLQYGPVEGTDNYNFPNSIDGYNHADLWRDAFWAETGNQQAIAILGNKARGQNWYGYYGERMRHDWVIADLPYPEFWETDPDGKGWRSHNTEPMIVFFNPADIASVANGLIPTYQPQPYAALRIDKNIFFSQNHEIFSASYDNQKHLLYITEFVRDPDGQLVIHVFGVHVVPVNVEQDIPKLNEFKLEQNYPNPFNPGTVISWQLAAGSKVQLKIFDILGREIATLVDEFQNAGIHHFAFSALNYSLNSGVYFYQLSCGSQRITKKLIILK
ncbi:MAG: T9SS type A sorting domain-containing protein [bacterium]